MHGIRRSVLLSVAAFILAAYSPAITLAQIFPFTWDQATVYPITLDQSTGDFKGITSVVESGYYGELSVNAILLSEPYGRIQAGSEIASGSDTSRSSGPIDYTVPDASYGSAEDFGDLVTAAHTAGLRVVIQVRLSASSDGNGSSSGRNTPDGALIPTALQDAWSGEKVMREESEMDTFFQRTSLPETADFMQVKWLVDWIRTYGIDGFIVLDVDSVDPAFSQALGKQSERGLRIWKSLNPDKTLDDSSFWMAGTGHAQALERGPEFDRGFDSIVSDHFLGQIEAGNALDEIYTAYAQAINSDPSFNILSSVSSSGLSQNRPESPASTAAALLMTPGGIQLSFDSDRGESDGKPEAELEIWKKLGSFRSRHPAIAAGSHLRINDRPYAFFRSAKISGVMDEVLVVMGASGRVRLTVSRVLPDDTVLKDVLTGKIGIVSFGQLSMQVGDSGMLLLELVR